MKLFGRGGGRKEAPNDGQALPVVDDARSVLEGGFKSVISFHLSGKETPDELQESFAEQYGGDGIAEGLVKATVELKGMEPGEARRARMDELVKLIGIDSS